MSRKFRGCTCCAALLLTYFAAETQATIPYSPVSGPFPGFGPGIITPDLVGGKEFSHDMDYEVTLFGPPDTMPDPQQVVAWDGTLGGSGVVDVTDFSGTRPDYDAEDEIDALANRGDFAYTQLKMERAHLLFSLDDLYHVVPLGGGGIPVPMGIPPGTPPGVTLGNGNVVGGSGEISYELGTLGGNPVDFQSVWAEQADINGMPLPRDIDGLEVWGPEPPAADADKYSLDVDAFSFGSPASPGDAVSVWNGSGTPYVAHSDIVAAVTALLGPIPATAFLAGPDGRPIEEDRFAINLDALMVHDVAGENDTFGRSPVGPDESDEIIFSIRQIIDPADPDGYYATGSELIVLNAGSGASYLMHGGHPWDHTYALSVFGGEIVPGQQVFAYDINAIEAVGEFAVPEPASTALLLVGLAAVNGVRRKREASGEICRCGKEARGVRPPGFFLFQSSESPGNAPTNGSS